MTARQTLDRATSEKEFLQTVIDFAKLHGWRTYHTYSSRRSTAGFPDLVLVRGETGEAIFAELKREGGRLTAEQQDWLRDLMRVRRVHTAVWRPSDWDAPLGVVETLALGVSRRQGWG